MITPTYSLQLLLYGEEVLPTRSGSDEYFLISSVALCSCHCFSNCLWTCKPGQIWKLTRGLTAYFCVRGGGELPSWTGFLKLLQQDGHEGGVGWVEHKVQGMLAEVEQWPLCARFLQERERERNLKWNHFVGTPLEVALLLQWAQQERGSESFQYAEGCICSVWHSEGRKLCISSLIHSSEEVTEDAFPLLLSLICSESLGAACWIISTQFLFYGHNPNFF